MASCYQSQAMSVSGFKMLEGVRSQAALRIKNTRDVGGGCLGTAVRLSRGSAVWRSGGPALEGLRRDRPQEGLRVGGGT